MWSFLPLQHGCSSPSLGLNHHRHVLRDLADPLCKCSMGFMEKEPAREYFWTPSISVVSMGLTVFTNFALSFHFSINYSRLTILFDVWLHLSQVSTAHISSFPTGVHITPDFGSVGCSETLSPLDWEKSHKFEVNPIFFFIIMVGETLSPVLCITKQKLEVFFNNLFLYC